MSEFVTVSPNQAGALTGQRHGPALSLARRFLMHLACQVDHGQLLVSMPSGEMIHRAGPRPGPNAQLNLLRWRAIWRLLVGGDIGFAEAYMDGDWSTPDLTALIELAALNHATMMPSLNGSRVVRVLNRLLHLRRNNTKRRSRQNIQDHYDLGNPFYAAWLDPGMSYSSGFYARAETTLEQAQQAKQDLVIDALALAGGERVLEIGFGWGGLATRLAREHGCHVTGLTLSPAQRKHAIETMASSCAPGSVDFLLRDYRDADGQYDRIVSIEMLEAVGKDYWPTYFATIRARLRPGGVAVLQVITMAEDRYAAYERGADFIQRYIFPGGMLPSDTAMRAHIAGADLILADIKTFGPSYARTLADWRSRFQRAWPRLTRMGFDEQFKRKWDYYLSYCEAGFRAKALDVGLYRFHRMEEAAR